jgi:hypothetical protein
METAYAPRCCARLTLSGCACLPACLVACLVVPVARSARPEEFTDLSLDFPPKQEGSVQRARTLTECLAHFTTSEEIEMRCEKCGKMGAWLAASPQIRHARTRTHAVAVAHAHRDTATGRSRLRV